jgi:hypothetical protein
MTDQPAGVVLPEISEEDRQFLHYNPNTDDLVKWVRAYATAAVLADRRRTLEANKARRELRTRKASSVDLTDKDAVKADLARMVRERLQEMGYL